MTRQILEGVKVLDLTRVLAGPWCTQSLADMGATVYKIERQRVGDDMRASPPFLRDAEGRPTQDTPSYLCVNRGKRSLTIDFTRPEGRDLLLDLVARCDVLVENFKAGDLQRHGLDYASVRRRQPSIVYCSITGYGQDGPMAAQPGYDPVFQAISGIMNTCGLPDEVPGGGPMRAMVPIVDVMTGMVSTSAVLAALLHKERTGEGQHIDMALLDVAMAASVHLGQNYLSTGQMSPRVGNGSFLFAPAGSFPCRDGHIFIQIGNDQQWARFCKAVDRADWMAAERFATNARRLAAGPELLDIVRELTLQWDKQALSDRLGEAGVPCGPVNDMQQAFAHPQVRHRGIRMQVPHPVHGALAIVRSPLRFSQTPVQHRAPPTLGADTAAVLQAELGMDSVRLRALQDAGVF